MKLIIEIPDSYNLDGIRNGSIYGQLVLNAVKNGTPIPNNATNGDVIKAMFPNTDIEIHNITVYVMFDMYSNVIPFDLDWWNAPYQKRGNSEYLGGELYQGEFENR